VAPTRAGATIPRSSLAFVAGKPICHPAQRIRPRRERLFIAWRELGSHRKRRRVLDVVIDEGPQQVDDRRRLVDRGLTEVDTLVIETVRKDSSASPIVSLIPTMPEDSVVATASVTKASSWLPLDVPQCSATSGGSSSLVTI